MDIALIFPVNPDHFALSGIIQQIVMLGVEVDYCYQDSPDAFQPVIWPLAIEGRTGAETGKATADAAGHFRLKFESEADMAQRLVKEVERIQEGELQK